MYQAYYHLFAEPFGLTPDSHYHFHHRSYVQAKAYLRYALQRAEGFAMVTGLPGTGKTTLIKEVMSDLDESRYKVVALSNTQVNAEQLLRTLAYAFSIRNESMDKATLLYVLENFLKHQRCLDKNVLVFVDEAQDLQADGLEALRLMTNLELDGVPLVQFVLIGQQQLSTLIRTPSMAQFRQRIIAAGSLQPLSLTETEEYVYYRLVNAGWKQDPIICHAVMQEIHQYTQGIPRLINQLCSRLFLYGCVENKHQFERADMLKVMEELSGERLAPINIDGAGEEDKGMGQPQFIHRAVHH